MENHRDINSISTYQELDKARECVHDEILKRAGADRADNKFNTWLSMIVMENMHKENNPRVKRKTGKKPRDTSAIEATRPKIRDKKIRGK